MLVLTLFLLLILLLAGVVVLYVAYPHRGHAMPVVPVVGEAMRSAVDAFPVLDEGEADAHRLARR